MGSMTIKTDAKADRLIEELKEFYGVCCTAALLRKGLALLALADEVKKRGATLAVVDSDVVGVQRVVI